MPCAAIFRTILTDYGMCCSFNNYAAETIFKDETLPKFIREMQDDDERHAVENSTAPEWLQEHFS